MSSRLRKDEALEKEERTDEMKKNKKKKKQQQQQQKKNKKKKKKKKQHTRPAPAASTAVPCPTICQSSRTPRHWKLLSTIARPHIYWTKASQKLFWALLGVKQGGVLVQILCMADIKKGQFLAMI